jgi:hypothetical protein
MKGAGHHLLAGAGLAADQDRLAGARHPLELRHLPGQRRRERGHARLQSVGQRDLDVVARVVGDRHPEHQERVADLDDVAISEHDLPDPGPLTKVPFREPRSSIAQR